MQLLNWQNAILDENDLSIFEVMAPRCSGKTLFSLFWSKEDADISIIISKDASLIRRNLKDRLNEYNLNFKEFHVIANLDQIRNLNTNQKRKIRIVVDDYFYQPEITLKKLDKAIGHENYKVLFIGTRRNKEDKFKIPFSKQYVVDLVKMLSEKSMTQDQFLQIINHLDSDQLELDFGSPFETN